MASGDTKTESYLRAAAEGTRADLPSDTCCNTKTQNLILGVANRIMDVEDEVEELKNNPDVVDIVDTYADLQAYDTSTLTDKDIIRVLEDSTHNDSSTYYRWNASTNQFDYIGEAGGGVNVVQTTGNSTTDVMSQDATTGLVYAKTTSKNLIRIGNNATTSTSTEDSSISIGTSAKSLEYSTIALGTLSRAERGYNIAIGASAHAYNGENEIAIGYNSGSTTSGSTRNISIGGSAKAASTDSVAIGYGAIAQYGASAVALGAGAKATQKGQFDISAGTSGTNGYNNTYYRLLTGLYDGSSDHDAATYGQVNTRLGGMTLVSISQTDYDNLGTKDPNTLYIITGA